MKSKKISRKATKRPKASSPTVRHRMQVTRRRDTPGELALQSALRDVGLRYRVDVTLPGTRRRPDVAFIGPRVAIFVDGCFWHGCPTHGTWPKANAAWWRAKIGSNAARDRDTDAKLRAAGWRVFRVWEHQNPGMIALKIAAIVNSAQRIESKRVIARRSRVLNRAPKGRQAP